MNLNPVPLNNEQPVEQHNNEQDHNDKKLAEEDKEKKEDKRSQDIDKKRHQEKEIKKQKDEKRQQEHKKRNEEQDKHKQEDTKRKERRRGEHEENGDKHQEHREQLTSPKKRLRTSTHEDGTKEDESQKRHTTTQETRQTAAPRILNIKDQPTQFEKREVPSSRKPAGNTLVIRQFVRPFQMKQLRELLEETGTVTEFWMDAIRTHCFVSYHSVEQAIKTREALHNLVWPKHGTAKLQVEFISREDANKLIERAENQSRTVSGAPHSKTVPEPPPDPTQTLDNLFHQTKAKPKIYYLPVSEEVVRRLKLESEQSTANNDANKEDSSNKS